MTKIQKLITAFMFSTTLVSAQTIVTVNGKAIKAEEVQQKLMMATQGAFATWSPEKQKNFWQQTVSQEINEELMYTDAKKSGVLKTKLYKEEYKKILERVKRSIAIQVWKQELHDGIKITEKAKKEYYKNNKGEFVEPERVHARHILLKTEDEAKAVILQLKGLKGDKLKAKFIELAKKDSTGPSGPRGGDLGTFVYGRMVPAFSKAAFALAAGTVTPTPVKTQHGYHVIYTEEKFPASTRSYDDVKSVIELRLKNEKFKAVLGEKLQGLYKKADIK